MPPAIAAIGVFLGAKFALGLTFGAALLFSGIQLGFGFLSQAMSPRPRSGSLSSQAQSQTVLFKATDAPRTIIYGQMMASGPLLYAGRNDATNEYLHFIFPVAGHEVEEIGDVYFNDTISTDSRFAGYHRIKKHLGQPDQASDSDAVSELTEWTSNHPGKDVAYIYVRLKHNPDIWTTGLPNVKSLVKGKKLYDPRAATKTITSTAPNGATTTVSCTGHGYSAGDSIFITGHTGAAPLVDGEYYISSIGGANDFEIRVAITSGGTGGTASKMVYSNNAALCQLDYLHADYGRRVKSAKIDLPSFIASANICDENVALDAVPNYQNRYECDGIIVREEKPFEIMEKLLTASAGALIPREGKYFSYAGAWEAATADALDDSYLRGDISIVKNPGRAASFNSVRGVFLNKADNWQLTDFPILTNATYEAEDYGIRSTADVEYPFTTDVTRVQRLAKLHLERHRRGTMVKIPTKWHPLEMVAGDVIPITNSLLSWSSKTFRVLNIQFSPAGGFDISAQEEVAAVYNWAWTDATVLGAPATITPPDAFTVAAPSSLALASGNAQLMVTLAGDIITRIKATWTAYTNTLVTVGGKIELQYKKSADSAWIDAPDVDGAATEGWIDNVEDGVNYDVRARAKNINYVKSAWSTVSAYTVLGKTDPPSNVADFVVAQTGNVINFSWTPITDADLAGYEIRWGPQGSTVWADGVVLTTVTKGTAITNAFLPPGSWTCLIKALDTSGNYSTAADTYDIIVTAYGFTDVITRSENPDWLGTKTNFVRAPSGVLAPKSQSLASASGWDTFDKFVDNPYATCVYETPELDAGFNDTIRAWAKAIAAMGPGETGEALLVLEIAVKPDGGAYGAWQLWAVGDVIGRYVKFRITMTTSIGIAKVTQMTPTIDLIERTEKADGVVIGASGTTITFEKAFHVKPVITTQAVGTGAGLTPMVTGESATGFTAHVYNASDTEVGGTINWQATGV